MPEQIVDIFSGLGRVTCRFSPMQAGTESLRVFLFRVFHLPRKNPLVQYAVLSGWDKS